MGGSDSLISIFDCKSSSNVLVLSLYFQAWTNEFLTWDPSEYGDVEGIYFTPDEIWVPDIALFNK